MNTELTTLLLNGLMDMAGKLDFSFIIPFVLIAHLVNSLPVRTRLKQLTGTASRTRYRTAITGIVYGTVLYFLRGYDLSHIEPLIFSFIFTLVFHKLLLDELFKTLGDLLIGRKLDGEKAYYERFGEPNSGKQNNKKNTFKKDRS